MAAEDKGVKPKELNNVETGGKKCFIITPIGGSNSEIFRHINGVIISVIRPLLESSGFSDIKAAHEIPDLGSINNQLVNRIIDDDLVIANLTGTNPNVMYELCLRHAAAKPVIHICEEGTDLPFDIRGERTIFYTNDMYGVEELKTKLAKALNSINYDKEYKDNPIYSAIQISNILKTDGNEKIDTNKVIIQQMEKLSNDVEIISRRLNSNNLYKKETIKDTRKDYMAFTIYVTDFTTAKFNRFINGLSSLIKGCSLTTSQELMQVNLTIGRPADENEIRKSIYMVANEVGISIQSIIVYL